MNYLRPCVCACVYHVWTIFIWHKADGITNISSRTLCQHTCEKKRNDTVMQSQVIIWWDVLHFCIPFLEIHAMIWKPFDILPFIARKPASHFAISSCLPHFNFFSLKYVLELSRLVTAHKYTHTRICIHSQLSNLIDIHFQ